MQAISDDIASGRVAVGARLPTEPELCAQHHVGRHTIREAIRGLVDLGMVERRPRVGTSVISAEPIAGGYRWLPGSVEDIAANVSATALVRPRGSAVEADEATARRLGCDIGERWFRFAGPRIIRGRPTRAPICFTEQYVPDTAQGRRAIRTASAAMSPDDVAHQMIQQEIRAGLLDDEQAAALDAEPGSAALVVVRRHINPDGRLVAIIIHTHPSDRFTITMNLPLEADSTPRRRRSSR